MVRWKVLALVATAFWGVWTTAALPADPPPMTRPTLPPCYGLLVAAVRDGVVYTVDESPADGPISGRLWEAPLRPQNDGKPEGSSRTLRDWTFHMSLERLHWRMVHGHLWCGDRGDGHRLALEDLPLLDSRAGEEDRAKLRKKYGDKHADVADGHMLDIADPAEELLATHANMNAGGLGTGLADKDWDMDILPTGPTTWDLFVLLKGELYIWGCTRKPERTTWGQFGAEGKLRCRPLRVGFQEPFFVYGSPESCFFVTKSGQVFWCLRGDDTKPEVVPVWDDLERPVTTILDDPDSSRTFVAGPDKAAGEGKWFYFQLLGKPEKKPFDRSAMETTKAEEPLKSALVFARFLLKEGKIKDQAK